LELPPSTMQSPFSSRPASLSTASWVTFPAGTISQMVRGASSFLTRSASEVAGRAPVVLAFSRAPLSGSKATTSWSESRRMRATMLPPMRPRPTKPIWLGEVGITASP